MNPCFMREDRATQKWGLPSWEGIGSSGPGRRALVCTSQEQVGMSPWQPAGGRRVSSSWETPAPPQPGMPLPGTALRRNEGFRGANPQLWAKVGISKSQPWPHNPLFGVLVENSNSNNNDDDDEERKWEKNQYNSGALGTFQAWPVFLPAPRSAAHPALGCWDPGVGFCLPAGAR